MAAFITIATVIGVIIISLAISFAESAILIYVASLIFSFAFNWWYVIGLMIILNILRSFIKNDNKKTINVKFKK